MPTGLFERNSDDDDRSGEFPLATIVILMVLFAVIAAYFLGPR